MSERQAKRARRTKSSAARPATESATSPPAESPEEPQAMTHPAVVVMRVPVEDRPGEQRIELMEINGLDPLSVPTLLRVAATIKENSLGLERK